MFKSSENLRLAADMRALQRVAAPWREARSTWFDGTPESIAARLAATERVLSYAKGGLTTAHLALAREASSARAQLIEAQHRLMVDFLDDGARAFKGSKRVAERGLRECINCGGGLSGEEDDDKESECPNCGMSAHHRGVDWRKSSRTAGHAHDEDYVGCPDCGSESSLGDFKNEHGHCPFCGKYNHELDMARKHGSLGPGYEGRPGFGSDDLAEYEDYLDRHDYRAQDDDLHALEHRLRPGFDDDDPARYSSRYYVADSDGSFDQMNKPAPSPQSGGGGAGGVSFNSDPKTPSLFGPAGQGVNSPSKSQSLFGDAAGTEYPKGAPGPQGGTDGAASGSIMPLDWGNPVSGGTGKPAGPNIGQSSNSSVPNGWSNLAPSAGDSVLNSPGMNGYANGKSGGGGGKTAAYEDEACEDCGADAGEKCRPWCTGKAAHDDEVAEKKRKKSHRLAFADFPDELMF